MSKPVIAQAAKQKFEQRMSHHYYLRKLSYLTQFRHPPGKRQQIADEKYTLLNNFKLYFTHYSGDRKLVDSTMQWIYRERHEDQRLWEMYGKYVMDNLDKYDAKSLVHVSNMMVKNTVPRGLFERVAERLVSGDLDALSTQEIAIVCKQAKDERLLRTVLDKKKVVVENEVDLYFFTSAFLSHKDKFPSAVELMKTEFLRIAPQAKSIQTLCQIMRAYGECAEPLPDTIIATVQSIFCSEQIPLRIFELHEVLITIQSAAYYNRFGAEFWERLEKKIVENARHYQAGRLLATLSRSNFLSPKVLSAVTQSWMRDIDKTQSKDIFREGFCAIAKFPRVDTQLVEWCVSQTVFFRQLFPPCDVARLMRAAVTSQWYSPALWKVLIDRFFSPYMSPPIIIDKSMVYFALKSLEIDKVDIPAVREVGKEKWEPLREDYEKSRFHTHRSEVHKEVANILREMKIEVAEFEKVAILYAPNFVLKKGKVVILCQDWPYHLIAGSRQICPGTQTTLRHLNKSGYSVVIVATRTDLQKHLKVVIPTAISSTTPRNLQIV